MLTFKEKIIIAELFGWEYSEVFNAFATKDIDNPLIDINTFNPEDNDLGLKIRSKIWEYLSLSNQDKVMKNILGHKIDGGVLSVASYVVSVLLGDGELFCKSVIKVIGSVNKNE